MKTFSRIQLQQAELAQACCACCSFWHTQGMHALDQWGCPSRGVHLQGQDMQAECPGLIVSGLLETFDS